MIANGGGGGMTIAINYFNTTNTLCFPPVDYLLKSTFGKRTNDDAAKVVSVCSVSDEGQTKKVETARKSVEK